MESIEHTPNLNDHLSSLEETAKGLPYRLRYLALSCTKAARSLSLFHIDSDKLLSLLVFDVLPSEIKMLEYLTYKDKEFTGRDQRQNLLSIRDALVHAKKKPASTTELASLTREVLDQRKLLLQELDLTSIPIPAPASELYESKLKVSDDTYLPALGDHVLVDLGRLESLFPLAFYTVLGRLDLEQYTSAIHLAAKHRDFGAQVIELNTQCTEAGEWCKVATRYYGNIDIPNECLTFLRPDTTHAFDEMQRYKDEAAHWKSQYEEEHKQSARALADAKVAYKNLNRQFSREETYYRDKLSVANEQILRLQERLAVQELS